MPTRPTHKLSHLWSPNCGVFIHCSDSHCYFVDYYILYQISVSTDKLLAAKNQMLSWWKSDEMPNNGDTGEVIRTFVDDVRGCCVCVLFRKLKCVHDNMRVMPCDMRVVIFRSQGIEAEGIHQWIAAATHPPGHKL